jgi:hypothetical protein
MAKSTVRYTLSWYGMIVIGVTEMLLKGFFYLASKVLVAVFDQSPFTGNSLS